MYIYYVFFLFVLCCTKSEEVPECQITQISFCFRCYFIIKCVVFWLWCNDGNLTVWIWYFTNIWCTMSCISFLTPLHLFSFSITIVLFWFLSLYLFILRDVSRWPDKDSLTGPGSVPVHGGALQRHVPRPLQDQQGGGHASALLRVRRRLLGSRQGPTRFRASEEPPPLRSLHHWGASPTFGRPKRRVCSKRFKIQLRFCVMTSEPEFQNSSPRLECCCSEHGLPPRIKVFKRPLLLLFFLSGFLRPCWDKLLTGRSR